MEENDELLVRYYTNEDIAGHKVIKGEKRTIFLCKRMRIVFKKPKPKEEVIDECYHYYDIDYQPVKIKL